MNLRETVEKYLTIAGGYGKAVPLDAFGLSREETERQFGALDEDYNISRFLHLSNRPGSTPSLTTYQINGFPHTHVSIDAEIARIL